MALHRVELTFAERICLSQALERQSGDIEVARYIKEIRRRFELRQATRALDKANLVLGRVKRGVSWDEILEDLEPLMEWIADQRELSNDEKVLAVLEDADERVRSIDLCQRSFTVDNAYIDWLRETAMKSVDWSRIRVRGPGGVREETVPVDLALMEVFAGLDEALRAAEPVRET